MKKILITGINGFAASHLARRLLMEDSNEIHGTIRVRSDLHRIEDIKDKIIFHYIELTDAFSVSNVVKKVKPDEIYHLAAQSSVRTSWTSPLETFRINVEGTTNLLEACRELEEEPRILNVSTSEVYGNSEGLVNEENKPQPNTPYGISKYAQELVGRMYYQAYGLPVITTRSFNVTGAGRADIFVDSSFAKQIVEIELHKHKPVVRHGNLTTQRDFTDVKDVIEAYILVLRTGEPGDVFVVGSGETYKIQDVLDILISLSKASGISDEIDKELFRPVDTKTMTADSSKLHGLGWKPTISFAQSMKELLEYWRNKLQ